MNEKHEQCESPAYEPPRVEDVGTDDGPAVTAAGKTAPMDDNTPQ